MEPPPATHHWRGSPGRWHETTREVFLFALIQIVGYDFCGSLDSITIRATGMRYNGTRLSLIVTGQWPIAQCAPGHSCLLSVKNWHGMVLPCELMETMCIGEIEGHAAACQEKIG